MPLEDFVQYLVTGIVSGSVYVILGLGYNVTFSATKVLNLANGDFLMVGMMLCLLFIGHVGMAMPLAILGVVLVVGLIGMVEERVAVRPVLGLKGSLGWVITTLSFALLMRNLAELTWGTEAYKFPAIFSIESKLFWGVRLSSQEIAIVATALIMAAGLHLFYTRTIPGKALRALAQDWEAASLRGINVSRMRMLAFSLGAVIASIGGIMMAPISYAYVHLGILYTFKAFIGVAVGGIGNNKGAVVGGLSVGLIEVFGANLIGAGYRTTIVLGFLLVILLIRPTGIFGMRGLRQV